MKTRLEWLLKDAREELVRADNKASLLLSATGVGVGALLAALLARAWAPSSLVGVAQWMWWLGAMGIAFAVCQLGVAVYPRTTARSRHAADVVAYYADVVRIGRTGLADHVSKEATEDALLDQLSSISEIVFTKYRLIQRALWGLALGALIILTSLGTNSVLSG